LRAATQGHPYEIRIFSQVVIDYSSCLEFSLHAALRVGLLYY